MTNSGEARSEKKAPDWIERLATLISAAVVLAVVAVLVWDAVHPDRPPALDASSGMPKVVGRHWHVPITVRNAGDVAVQEVSVRVALERPDTAATDIDIRIDWLPGRSEREIDAVFAVDPARGKLVTQVQSFDAP